jgi:hypothetical protein
VIVEYDSAAVTCCVVDPCGVVMGRGDGVPGQLGLPRESADPNVYAN